MADLLCEFKKQTAQNAMAGAEPIFRAATQAIESTIKAARSAGAGKSALSSTDL